MNGRAWTKKEINKLYRYAETVGQPEAARRLGRSLMAVKSKVRSLGIRWNQGTVSLNSIAQQLDCSPVTVARTAGLLFWNKTVSRGKGNGKRYTLTLEEADQVHSVLSRTLKVRHAHRVAGRKGR